MGVCNRGKCFIYVSNFDGTKNQTGGTEQPYVPSTQNTSLNGVGPFYRGSNYTNPETFSFYLSTKNLFLRPMSSDFDFNPAATGYNGPIAYADSDFAPIVSSSYNITEEKISYQNPIILHITTTFKKLNDLSKPIYGIILYGDAIRFNNNKVAPILLAYEHFDEPININKDDTITFTMIIK